MSANLTALPIRSKLQVQCWCIMYIHRRICPLLEIRYSQLMNYFPFFIRQIHLLGHWNIFKLPDWHRWSRVRWWNIRELSYAELGKQRWKRWDMKWRSLLYLLFLPCFPYTFYIFVIVPLPNFSSHFLFTHLTLFPRFSDFFSIFLSFMFLFLYQSRFCIIYLLSP